MHPDLALADSYVVTCQIRLIVTLRHGLTEYVSAPVSIQRLTVCSRLLVPFYIIRYWKIECVVKKFAIVYTRQKGRLCFRVCVCGFVTKKQSLAPNETIFPF